MVQNSLSFCLSEKLLISPSYLNEILAGYNNLGCRLLLLFSLYQYSNRQKVKVIQTRKKKMFQLPNPASMNP